MKTIPFICITGLLLTNCRQDKDNFDASGSFESVETIISSEATGRVLSFNVEEGQLLHSGQLLGYIDSTQLYLRKKQLLAQTGAVLSRRPDVKAQLAALEEQLATAEKEQQRVSKLVKSDAASTKQLDDVNAQVEVLKKQIAAQRSMMDITTTGLENDTRPIEIQVEQIEDQLAKCRIISPMRGTVLRKYTETNEVVMPGKPLFKMANLDTMILRVYLSGSQLPEVKIGQLVKVHTDDGKGGLAERSGIISWISDKAEFTPKTVQTKDERANMVYAAKVEVKNDGTLKIGMYGEISWH